MQYGICHLSVVAVNNAADYGSILVTQLLYGDHFKVKEKRKTWSRIQTCFDKYEGWVLNSQITIISEATFNEVNTNKNIRLTIDFVSQITTKNGILTPILMGSRIDIANILQDTFEGNAPIVQVSKSNLVSTALAYLNAPYQNGGKTAFGIDCSGLSQMVYKINGYQLFRETEKQATQGEPLSFIEESEPGDLAFFDNNEGVIDHVGIILEDNYIIHVHGNVRIDRLDHTGIFNVEHKLYSHKLRVIKKIA